MCLNLPKHIAWVFFLLWRKAISYSDGGASAEDALWIPYSRVNLQSHRLRDMKYIFWTLMAFRKKACFHDAKSTKRVSDESCGWFPECILYWGVPDSPTPLYLNKISKSLIEVEDDYCIIKIIWNLPLCCKVVGETEGHRKMHICVYAIPTSFFPPLLPPSHNAITETWFSLRNQN